jgi:HEAT repeat protein
MLDGLKKIDWDNLTHAYGTAEDVPDLLRGLASRSAEAREEIWGQLWCNIWHQGTVYEATAHAVPFLIELLQGPRVPDKHQILSYLRQLAQGNSYHDKHRDLWEATTNAVEKKQWEAVVEEELSYVRAARDAVVAGTPVYLQLLDAREDETRRHVPDVLEICTENREVIVPCLLTRISKEKDVLAKASMLLRLARLFASKKTHAETAEAGPSRFQRDIDQVQSVQNLMNSGEAALIRLLAAVALVQLSPQDVAPEVVPVLRDTISSPTLEQFSNLNSLERGSFQDIASLLEDYPDLYQRWVIALLGHPDSQVRAQVASSLGFMSGMGSGYGLRFAVPALGELLHDSETKVREAAADTLKSMTYWARQAVPAFIEALYDESEEVRQNAAQSLGQLRAKEAIPALLTAIRERKLGTPALKALQQIGPGHDEVVPALIAALAEPSLRGDAAQTLGSMGRSAKPAIPALAALLPTEDRFSAVVALGKIGVDAEPVIPELIEFLDSENDRLAAAAAEALGWIGPAAKDALPKLKARLSNEDARESWCACALALWRIDSQGELAVPALIDLLEDKGWERVHVANALAEIGPDARAAVPALRNALRDRTPWVRVSAANALWRIERQVEAVLPALLSGLHGLGGDAVMAARSLGEMGPQAQAAVPALCQALQREAGGHPVTELLKVIGDEPGNILVALSEALRRILGEAKANSLLANVSELSSAAKPSAARVSPAPTSAEAREELSLTGETTLHATPPDSHMASGLQSILGFITAVPEDLPEFDLVPYVGMLAAWLETNRDHRGRQIRQILVDVGLAASEAERRQLKQKVLALFPELDFDANEE